MEEILINFSIFIQSPLNQKITRGPSQIKTFSKLSKDLRFWL